MRKDRPYDKAFTVEFVSENGIDAGGPYRELLDSVCTELKTNTLPILIPSPN